MGRGSIEIFVAWLGFLVERDRMGRTHRRKLGFIPQRQIPSFLRGGV